MAARTQKEAGNEREAAREKQDTVCEKQDAARGKQGRTRGKQTGASGKQARTGGEQAKACGGQSRTCGERDQACGKEDLTRCGIIHRYLEIYRRCMAEDPKAFDARGAAHALEQIGKLLGLTVSAKDTDGNEIVLTLSGEANALGQ